MDSASLLVSKKDAAQALGVCVRTVENLLSAHALPARRIGRRVLIPRRALEQFARRDHNPKKAPDASTGTVASTQGAR
jgi:excisionase family DNA binding protein